LIPEEEEEDVIIDLEGEVDVALLGKGGCRGRGWQENGWPQVRAVKSDIFFLLLHLHKQLCSLFDLRLVR
jgi:hypothetical protein